MTLTNTAEYNFLRSLTIFSPLEDTTVQQLAAEMRGKKFRRGQYVFAQEEGVDKLYILARGEIEIFQSDENGKKLTLWAIEEKQPFCLANLFAGRSFANAVATKDSVCYYIGKKRLDSCLASGPELSRQFITCISSKLAAYSMLLEEFTFKNVEARLVKLLLKVSVVEQPSLQHVCTLTQNEIACLLGCCREVVSRTIKKLKDKELIGSEAFGRKSRILILDYEQLRKLSEEC